MSTPFEREILTHHWVSPAPFPRETETYYELLGKFVSIGLLRLLMVPNQYGSLIDGNTEAMAVYQKALGEVPFPIREWRMPS